MLEKTSEKKFISIPKEELRST